MTSVSGEAWFSDPALVRVLALLNGDGGEGRVAGGAVRNSLMGLPVADVDIATTLRPEVVVERAKAAGIKAVPTGIEHGTVTLVIDGTPFEVTTLRRDVATNGRHAEVAFGTDWQTDAERRDLTINALYATGDGRVIDLVNGLPDIESRTVRFIGDAAMRIAEDHLRILRFFRFFALYGSGRPDAEGLKACARAKTSLAKLSAERVWSETKRLVGVGSSGAPPAPPAPAPPPPPGLAPPFPPPPSVSASSSSGVSVRAPHPWVSRTNEASKLVMCRMPLLRDLAAALGAHAAGDEDAPVLEEGRGRHDASVDQRRQRFPAHRRRVEE